MGIAGAIGGALIQGASARSAARSQERSANQDIAFQTETRDLIRNDLAQYREGGGLAQSALDFELGLGARPMIGGMTPQVEEFQVSRDVMQSGERMGRDGRGRGRMTTVQDTRFRVGGQQFATREEADAYARANTTGGTAYGGFTRTPGYDFRLQEGQRGIEASAAARGGLNSGAAMRDLLRYGQDYASSEYGNYLSRLGARADTGLSAAQMSGQAGQQAAAGVSNALSNRGNAQAAGAVGFGNALNQGIGDVAGVLGYQRNLAASGAAPNGFNIFGRARA